MELSSVGRHMFIVIFLIGSNVLPLNAQGQPAILPADRADPQLPGVPVRPGIAPADCGILPTVCAFNTSLPHYQDCRRYYTCGFSNNWQPRQCRGNQGYDTDTLTCVPSSTAKCASCADRSTPVDCTARPLPCNDRDLLPDYSNCKKYYRCIANTWQSSVCTGNNNFDQTTMTCRNVRQAQCSTCTVAPGPTRSTPVDCTARPLPCNDRDLLPDYNNCKKYYRCIANTWQSSVCTGNNNFDQTTMTCRNVRQAQCSTCTVAPGPTRQPPVTAIEATIMPNPIPPATRPVPTRPVPTRPVPTRVPLPTRVPIPSRVPPTLIPPFTRIPRPPVPTPRPYNPAEWGNNNDAACSIVPTDPCNQPNLLVANVNNCSTYYECVGSTNGWLLRPCAFGTDFDPTRLVCDHPRNVKCQLPCPRRECNLAASGSCTLDEMIANPNDCSRFSFCWALGVGQRPEWRGGKCPNATPYFNSRTLTCDPSPNSCIAPCIPPTVPSPPAATTPATTTPSLTTTAVLPTQQISKDLTWILPTSEICNSPNRRSPADHASCTPARQLYVHRHPTICNIVYICLGGEWKRSTCPPNDYWSAITRTCVPKSAGVCFNITCLTSTTLPSTPAITPSPTTPATTASTTSEPPSTEAPSTEAPTTSTSTKAPTTPPSTVVTSTPVVTDSQSTASTSTIGQQSPPTDSTTKATPGTTSSTTTIPVVTSTPPADTTTQPPTTVSKASTQSTASSPASSPSTTSKTSPTSPSISTPTATMSTTTSKGTTGATIPPVSTTDAPVTNRSSTQSSTMFNSTPYVSSSPETTVTSTSASTTMPSTTTSPTTTLVPPTDPTSIIITTPATVTPALTTNTTSPTTTPETTTPTTTTTTTPETPTPTPTTTPTTPTPTPTTTPTTPTPTPTTTPTTPTPTPTTTPTTTTPTTTSTTTPETTTPTPTTTPTATIPTTITTPLTTPSTTPAPTTTPTTPTPTTRPPTTPSTTPIPTTPSTTLEPTSSTDSPSTITPTISTTFTNERSTTTLTPTTSINTSPTSTSSTTTTSATTISTASESPSPSQASSTTPTVSTIFDPSSTKDISVTSVHTSTKPANMTNASFTLTSTPSTAHSSGSTVQSSPSTNATTADPTTTQPTKSTPGLPIVTTEALPVECEMERTGPIVWPQTPIGGEARGGCPRGVSGYSIRQCEYRSGLGATWKTPDTSLCVDPPYTDVLVKAEQLQAPPPSSPPRPIVTEKQLKATIMKLSMLTTRDVRQDQGIQGGNLNASVETVSLITRLVEDRNLNLTQLEIQALFNTAGNLLSAKNKKAWETITRQDPSRGVTVMASVDEIGRQMARNSGGNPVTTRTGSLAIRAEIRRKDEIETFDYTPDPGPGSTPDPTGLRDRVILEKKTLEELSDYLPGDMVAVWSTYYYTINDYLPVKGEDFLNSRVMSVSIQSLPAGKILRPPVRLYFAPLNNTVGDVETHCSFWKFGAMNRGRWSDEGCTVVSTDASGTVCECEHLTNFAILLSPSPASGMHATILDIISVIGCLLSILGMLITICLYILSWKRVKSHHAAVLINLCIALIIANTTFLAGIQRTEDKLICTVVAAMLHFFYLVAFFMMFADGVQFILYVVQVFHVRRKKETFLLVLTCWVIPGVIVAITMSITRAEGYGTEDYCWLRKDTGLIAAFAVPAILVMIANFVVLCKILHTISNSKGSERTNRVKATIWNVAVMMPLLGLTWVFALFAVNDQTITFQYLFCICNSLQGFFIFFFHCALNKKMRQAVVERFSSRSSLSSSMRKSAGSNKSDKKKCAEKKSNKKATKNNRKGKPEISPPKPTGRQREYIVPRNAHQGATPAYNDQQHYQGAPLDGSHQMAPPSGVPTPPPIPEPQYMDLEEVKGAVNAAKSSPLVGRRLEAQYPTGYRPGEREAGGQPYGSSPADGYRSADRRAYGNQRGLPRYQQQQQGVQPMAGHHNNLSPGPQGYSSLERRPYGYDVSPDLRYRRDRDMQQIDLDFAANENSLNRGGNGGGYGGSWDRRGESSDVDQPPPWWYGGPHTNKSFRHSMSMDDLRMVGGPPTQEAPMHPSSNGVMPRAAVEDPYLLARSHEDDMVMQTNPLAHARTFDPRRPARKSPYLERVHRMGSHSRSLDRLDQRGRSPRRHHKAPAAISTASMQRFASKENGGAYIILEPQVYENLSFDGLKGHTSDEPVYMQIDDVTVLDSQVSLDFMAGRA